jgi:uncharacterized protein (DUF362 family)
MNRLMRRDVLARSAAASGFLALRPGLALADDKPADMAIAKWAGAAPEGDAFKAMAAKLTEKAIEAIGGMGRFVKKGDVVWVKPNIAWDRKPELAANTNPDVVAAVIKLCLAAGAKTVKVGDFPVNPAPKTYESTGIAAAAKAAGAEVLLLDKSRFKEMDIKGEKIKTLPVCPDMIECDLLINVPIVKHHRLSQMTMCMKNYMGCVDKRNVMHQDLATSIADVTRFMKPRLSILDAIRILKANGPSSAKIEDVETKLTLAAGLDVVALDAWGAEVAGKKPESVGSIVKGQAYGLGKIDYRSLKPREIAVS